MGVRECTYLFDGWEVCRAYWRKERLSGEKRVPTQTQQMSFADSDKSSEAYN